MTDAIYLVQAFAAGLLLGLLFFGGLWWTTRKGIMADNPALWFIGSLILRNSIVAAGFYIITNGHWQRALMCLLGFILSRLMMLRLTDTMLPRRRKGGM